jgi:hypothetical protein
MSRLELKQTWSFALQMSAYDPKRTLASCFGPIRDVWLDCLLIAGIMCSR